MRFFSPRTLMFSVPALGVVGIIGWYIGLWLRLQGWRLWALRVALWLLGSLIVYLVHRLLPKKGKKEKAPEAVEVVDFLSTASRRLTASGVTGKQGLRSLPVVLFLGPARSAKTSVVQQAGLETDLLAGDGDGGEPPPPTPNLNLWLSRDTLFLEAGEGVFKAPQGWTRVLDAIRTGSWRTAFKEHPSRVAVVCVGSEHLTGGDRGSLNALAKELRGQLEEAAVRLDRRLPVYVLFTKADEIPHFTEFVRNLSEAEAGQPLGVTLPLAEGEDPGLYNRWQSARLERALESVFLSLSHRRPEVLAREGNHLDRTSAYEFPREFRKVTDEARDFLLELTRPSQLRINPFLRGFYFTGIRPVAVDARPEPAVAPPVPDLSKGATMVFDPSQIPGAAPPPPVSRSRVAQWTFLGRLLTDVVLPDKVAVEASMGGPQAAFRKRMVLGSGLAAVSVLALLFLTSYLGNRGLQRETREAIEAVQAVRPSAASTPLEEDLQALDSLGDQVAKLAEYDHGRRPLRFRWGLFSGSPLYREARRVYFGLFRSLLYESTRADLIASLGDGPEEAPSELWEAKYSALKAYMITTRFPDSSSVSFMGPALQSIWSSTRSVDEVRLELARRQFDLFASELRHEDPYADVANEPLISQTRAYLKANANADSYYAGLRSEANGQFESVLFNRDHPESQGVLRSGFEVPGAFTEEGWGFVLNRLDNIERFLTREAWVVGDQFYAGLDTRRMSEELTARYKREYVEAWIAYLGSGQISRYAGARGAARALDQISSPSSPLFQFLAEASRHTSVDSAVMGDVFQPLHLVSPPDAQGQLYGEVSRPYVQELGALSGALALLAENPGDDGARDQATQARFAADGQVLALRSSFSILNDQAGEVALRIERLLRAPVGNTEVAISGSINQVWAERRNAFCRGPGAVLQRFPFQIGGADADLSAVAALQAETTSLWEEVQDSGRQPSPAFREFRRRVEAVSTLLFDARPGEPYFRFLMIGQPSTTVPEIVLNLDGQEVRWTQNQRRGETLIWDGRNAREVVLSARVGEQVESLSFTDTWALFKLLHQADWQASGEEWRLTWRLGDSRAVVRVDLTLQAPEPILLNAGMSRSLSCPQSLVGTR